jgi:putative ABC transport system permease protein
VSSQSSTILWIQAVAFLLGLALLIYVINRVGVQPIFDALGRIGYGFFLLLAINSSRHFFRTAAMMVAVHPEHRRFSYLNALSARFAGEAISFLTFTGPLLGEATKAAMLRKRVPLVHGVPALVVDNLVYYISVIFFILGGTFVMLIAYPLPSLVKTVLIGIAVAAFLGIVVVVLAENRRAMVLSWSIDKLSKLGFNPHFLSSRRDYVYQIESNVYDFSHDRPGSFWAILGIDFLAHASSVVEVYVTLRMLGFGSHVQAAYVIESLTKVINFAFGFVPATIGVYEGGTELILRTLGFVAATGVTLALVRKASTIFLTGIGLVILLSRALPNATRGLIDRSPGLRKIMDSLVLSNIAHRPARTTVSVIGIALGVLLIVFTVGLAHGILRERGQREANIGAEFLIRPSGTLGMTGSAPFIINVARADEIAKLPGVRRAVPIGQLLLKSDSGFGSRLVEGIEFDRYADLTGITIREGRKLETGDEAMVDTVWQRDNKATIGGTITLYDRPFTIVGVYGPPGGGRIKIPLSTMQKEVGIEQHCTTILVSCIDPTKQDEVGRNIAQVFPDLQVIPTKDLPDLYVSSIPALNVFLRVVVGVASAISMLVILLAMYTTVTERTKQIGILKSLGMSKSAIAWVIQQEAILVSLLGVGVGISLTMLLRFAVMKMTSLTVEIEPFWIFVAFIVSMVGGTIGAMYPAIRAARQDAVDALSYE